MTGDLGALGFWLMLGMVLAAGTVSEALKARDKERERQATLRALMDRNSNSVTEILAYMRERDGAERELHLTLSGMNWRWPSGTRAVVMGILACAGVIAAGVFTGAALHFVFFPGPQFGRIPLIAMFGIWAAAPIVAWRVWRSSKQKNDAHVAA